MTRFVVMYNCIGCHHTYKTVYGSELASLMDTVASLYTKQKVKHSVRKSIPKKGML